MKMPALRVATLLAALACSASVALAVDLEVVVHKEAPSGTGVADLDLLVCRGGPCIAAATTDRKGRAVFPDIDPGDLTVRAVAVPCGPFDWPVSLGAKAATQRVEVVIPATGRLRVQVSRLGTDGKSEPLAGTNVRFVVNGSSGSPTYPNLLSAGTRTDSQGVGELCFPAGSEFNVAVEVAGYKAASLPKQQIRAGEVSTARIALHPEGKP
jgi:hypothetical protein